MKLPSHKFSAGVNIFKILIMLNKTHSSLGIFFSLLFPCVFRGLFVNFSICLCGFLLLVMVEIWSLSGRLREKKTKLLSIQYYCNFSLECFDQQL